MILKRISFKDIGKNEVRFGNGSHITEAVLRKFLSVITRKYTYPDSQKSPIVAVFAAIYNEQKQINYFVDTNHYDSYKLNKMHGVSFEEKPGKISRWEKSVLEKHKFFEKGKINLLQYRGLSFRLRFNSWRLGWQSFKPIYIYDANRTRISGIIFIISKEKNIFANVDDDFDRELIEWLTRAIQDSGQQRTIDPEIFLSEKDLLKMKLYRNSNLLTLGTVGSSLWTAYSFITKLYGGYLLKQVMNEFSSAFSLFLTFSSMLIAIQYERIMIADKKQFIADTENLYTGDEKRYDLLNNMQISDINYLQSEYVRDCLKKNKDLFEKEFNSFLAGRRWLKYFGFKWQLAFFKRTFRPMTRTNVHMSYFYNYVKGFKKISVSKNKMFYRCALKYFLEERARFLINKLGSKHGYHNNLVFDDYVNIVKSSYFKNFMEVNNNAQKISKKSKELFIDDLNARQLSVALGGFSDFLIFVRDLNQFSNLQNIKLKFLALSKNKFRKELIIINVLKDMLAFEENEDNKLVLNKLLVNIQNNFLFYGIFEKRYQDEILKPHIEVTELLDNLKQKLDYETAMIAGVSRNIYDALNYFFNEDRLKLFDELEQKEQKKFFNMLIDSVVSEQKLSDSSVRELVAHLNRLG